MRATITVDDDLLHELLVLTGTENRTAAINAAIESHVRRLKLEGLRGLAGQVDIASNEESCVAGCGAHDVPLLTVDRHFDAVPGLRLWPVAA